jgi:hypothetical protein
MSEVLKAVTMNSNVFWDMTQYTLVDDYRQFRKNVLKKETVSSSKNN